MGALLVGNRPTLKSTYKVAIVMEQFLRLMNHCGAPLEDIDFINCRGKSMEKLIAMTKYRTG